MRKDPHCSLFPRRESARRHRGSASPFHTSQSGIAVAEFAPTLMVLILVLFPLINLLGVATGFACETLVALESARRAASARSLPDALEGMVTEAGTVATSGFGSFAKMRPTGGYGQSGTDLYLKVTSIYSGATTTYGPNIGLPSPIDVSANIYEGSVRAVFDLGPLISMSFIPGFKDIPGLGKPARLACTWDRHIEHPDSFLAPSAPQLTGGTSILNMGAVLSDPSTDGTPMLPESGWNYPNIYAMIAAAGQTVVDEDVLRVFGNNAYWTPTTLNVQQGDKIWIDYRADGVWSISPVNLRPTTDANGYQNEPNSAFGIKYGAMIGRLGAGGTPFFLGKQQWNFTPPGNGTFYLAMNDDYGPIDLPAQPSLVSSFTNAQGEWGMAPAYSDNSGLMTVRIIIAR